MANRPDNVMYASDEDEDFPIQKEEKKQDRKREMPVVDHKDGECSKVGCQCEFAKFAKLAQQAALAPHGSNYSIIEKLAKNLVTYLEEQKITGIDEMMSRLKQADAATKLLFIRTYLCPRVKGLRNDIKANLASATPEQMDKIARYLEAMCEVAEQ